MSQPPADNPPVRDARRPGLGNRIRRLMHPHRRTVVRLAVASLVTIAALAVVGGAIRSLRADGRPPIRPDEVDELQADWVNDLDAGAVVGLATDGPAVFATTDEALVKLDARCSRPTDVTPSPGTPSASGSASPCAPSWRGAIHGAPLSPPVVFDGHVFAGSSTGLVYAFPTDCAAEVCEPAWVGVAGDSPVSQPAVNDDFVYVTSDRLYAFPIGCGTDDRVCSPVWTADIPGRPTGDPPAVGGGLVIVTSSGAGGSVYAFPAVCSARCQPVWAASTSGEPSGAALEGGTAYLVAGGRLLAFGLSCQGTCNPVWSGSFPATSTVGPGAASAPAPQGDLVYVAAAEGTLWVFEASCPESSCDPSRSFDLSDSALWRPSSQGGVAYLTSGDGELHAVIGGCDPSANVCAPSWSAELGSPTAAAAAVGEGSVYAGDDSGRIYAFSLPTTP